MKKLLLIPAALLLSTAAAAPKISAQSIIVNPAKPDLAVQVSVNKDTGTNAIPNYVQGENIAINVKTNRDAYVYLFYVEGNGEATYLPLGDNFVKANTVASFPSAGADYTLSVDGTASLNKVLAVASLTPLDLTALGNFKDQQNQVAPLATKGQTQLAQALSIVVNQVPQNSWVTDATFFNVVNRTPIQTGSLFVGSNVNDAVVYLNNQRLGNVNATFSGIRPGTYTLRVTTNGYRDLTGRVNITAGGIANYSAEFYQAVAPAPVVSSQYTFTINSRVEGARVFINGRELGTIRNGGISTALKAGRYEVVFIAPGYKTYINNVDIVNRNAQLSINP